MWPQDDVVILGSNGKALEKPKPIGQRYAESMARERRDTRANLELALLCDWTGEEFRHWVETGEQPAGRVRVFE